ncbi:MAG: hypothetical protein SFX73_14140 [Kofleriaceae bacterium]|nr:hypothetical protein [Kofleriaceae bacterium]
MVRALVAVLVGVVACANPNLGRAKHARYDADAASVFQGALDATQSRYSTLEAFPGQGLIKTAWHQVRDDGGSTLESTQQQRTMGGTGTLTRHAHRRVFVRFDIRVTGERPYTVAVKSFGAEWKPGNAMPTELDGVARPGWVEKYADSLRADIYERLRSWAVAPATTASR